MWLMPRPLCWRWLGVLAARFLDCGNRWMVLACCAVLKNWWLCTKDAISQSNPCFPSHHFQSLWFKARGKWSPSKWSTLSWPPCMIEEQRKSKPCSPICKTWRQVRRTLQSTYLLSIYLSICLSACLSVYLCICSQYKRKTLHQNSWNSDSDRESCDCWIQAILGGKDWGRQGGRWQQQWLLEHVVRIQLPTQRSTVISRLMRSLPLGVRFRA